MKKPQKNTILQQHFTIKDCGMTKPVLEFLEENPKPNLFDPFAGRGDLFKQIDNFYGKNHFKLGYDLDPKMGWPVFDSLTGKMPNLKDFLIVTNPPFLSKSSCSRQKLGHLCYDYFKGNKHDDLYKIALEKIIKTGAPGIAIVPESFLNSNFKMCGINKIVVVEENPFSNTTAPICVVLFNGRTKLGCHSGPEVGKNDDCVSYLADLKEILDHAGKPINKVKFNDPKGKLALIAVDSTGDQKIEFLPTKDLLLKKPNLKINSSSRAITLISHPAIDDLSPSHLERVCRILNEELSQYREEYKDLFLTPFKGNNKAGHRRRRLDFKMASKLIVNNFCYMI